MALPCVARVLVSMVTCATLSFAFQPAPQHFRQEVARRFPAADGGPTGPVQLVECPATGPVRAFAGGQWYELRDGRWQVNSTLAPRSSSSFTFATSSGDPVEAQIPWQQVQQVLHAGLTNIVASRYACLAIGSGGPVSLGWPESQVIRQVALSPGGLLHIASGAGLWALRGTKWERLQILDDAGRDWVAGDVTGVAFDSKGQLWIATKAGVGCRTPEAWVFYEGKDGLPWNDFTGITASPAGEIWFTTHLGVIRFDGKEWHYRQGPCWLPSDDVCQAAVDSSGNAWFATRAGVGRIELQPMTLAAKAEFFEQEIERYIKRTPFGYVSQARLRTPADKSSADPQDSDNDGLWTSMYGAGECFAYAATGDAKAKRRAAQAFEALRFLQKVTQGGSNQPPKGFVARSIRPTDWADPNVGLIERDRAQHRRDPLWKVYEPRWPRSADGKWYWKSDTSSDELDGHYFFYPLYYDLCADTDAERERVREIVRDLTDHLLAHRFVLIDHDGKPTRWARFDPEHLNHDPQWWPERGLNSLSLLSYLAVAAHVTADPKYDAASRELIAQHGYGQNAMYPKVQQGPGSGNQSDDEMAFMDFYSLLRCSRDDELKRTIRVSFYRYYLNEVPEMNPFFNFAFAAVTPEAPSNGDATFPIKPDTSWLQDAMTTLYGLPLDRLNWAHRNRHRLDIVELPRVQSIDFADPDAPGERGSRANGKVLLAENRHFNHWNTDPWKLDYAGNGGELGAGTVFLLPYYMGLYHGFIRKPD